MTGAFARTISLSATLAVVACAGMSGAACAQANVLRRTALASPCQSTNAAAISLSSSKAHSSNGDDKPVKALVTEPDGLQPDGLYVRANHLCSNGSVFIFKGVQIVGLVGPISLIPKEYVVAQQHFGQEELRAAKKFGANGIRFQIGQYGNDPESSGYNPRYVKKMIKGVDLALKDGFRVIICVQAQRPDGGAAHHYGSTRLPDQGTLRVWQRLAPIWKNDTRVMFELFNEPAIDATAGHWNLAVNGGTSTKNISPDNPRGIVVGYQELINVIRAMGAKNVIIVPGLNTEEDFTDIVRPDDPLNDLAYGLHSPPLAGSRYFTTLSGGRYITVTPAFWDEEFGFLTKTAPVILTEWAALPSFKYCVPDESEAVSQLLSYFIQHNISVNGFAFDVQNTLIRDWSYTPTAFDPHTRCHQNGAGPGELLHQYYTTTTDGN